MNAIQFIKQHGVDRAREELKKLPSSDVTHMTDDARMFVDENNPLLDEFHRSQIKDLICIEDLKRLIDSVDFYKELKTKKNANREFTKACMRGQTERANKIKKAIADYEAIGGEHV